MKQKRVKKWQVWLILILGVLAVSTASILIRLCFEVTSIETVGFSLFLAASRLTLSALILVPVWRNFQGYSLSPQACYYAGAAGIALAIHFATWITSLSFTSIIASTTLVTTNPIWVTIISWLWFQEKPQKMTILGIIIALIGSFSLAFVSQTNSEIGSNSLLGNILALIGSLMVSCYFILGKKSQELGLKISQYIVIAYSTSALILFPFPLLLNTSYLSYPPQVYFYLLLMAIIPQLIGHTILNWSVNQISPTTVTLGILFEPVFASFLAFWLFGEIPQILVVMSALIILLGVAIAVIYPSQ
jgi:drug/metabolite transporter (DMT)-like permease